MRYHGGKAKAASKVFDAISNEIKFEDFHIYVEPFVGAANVFSKMAPHFKLAIGMDLMPDIIKLWQDATEGWVPPTSITKEEYEALRNAEPSALRAYAGFGNSFGGKFFNGFAASSDEYDHAGAAYRGIMRKVAMMKDSNSKFICCDYRQYTPSANTLIYCDPPYFGTTPYKWLKTEFDSQEFYSNMEAWVGNGATVFVSESQAPSNWKLVSEWEQRGTLRKESNSDIRVERLYRVTP